MADLKRSERQILLDRDPRALSSLAKKNGDFLEFYRSIVDEKTKTKVNPRSWSASFFYLELFTGGKCRFTDLTADFAEDYQNFLLNSHRYDINLNKPNGYNRKDSKKLSPNSARIYFGFFVSVIEKAVRK